MKHLKRFPIDTLKIDHSFVRNLPTDVQDGTIVGAVIGLGAGLNMRVVAEGVETAEQLAFLQAHQCDEGQGLYFYKPMDAAEISRLLKARVARVNLVDARTSDRGSLGRRTGTRRRSS